MECARRSRKQPRRAAPRPTHGPALPARLDAVAPRETSLAEQLITTQSPQRPQSTPRIRIEVDGHVVEGFEGQTILEVCRDNGIEIPTLCYEPKLPGFGACRSVGPKGRRCWRRCGATTARGAATGRWACGDRRKFINRDHGPTRSSRGNGSTRRAVT